MAMKDFRQYLTWTNFVRSLKRGADKDRITKDIGLANYIALLEGHIQELEQRIAKMEHTLEVFDDGR